MALEPYDQCPCGSGKKFKWCCQPIHQQIDKAFRQDAEGQHDAALRLMEEVVTQNPANSEAWGRKAQMLYQHGKVEEAEVALEKAFAINPKYAFGFLLRGSFRANEGELPGALICYRKAADAYDPEARDLLAQVHMMIADCELKLNRPVAARAALQIATHCQPGNTGLKENVEQLFGKESRLPAAARHSYTFMSPGSAVAEGRRAAWDKALAGAATGKLSDAVRAFEQLTKEDESDAAAWYNLGLARAWLGENRAAIEALERYLALENDETRAAAAWAVAEVLRCGQGLEEQCDYVEYGTLYQMRDPQAFFSVLQDLEQSRRLVGVQVDQQNGVITALVLDSSSGGLIAPTAAPSLGKMACYMLVMQNVLRLWGPNKEGVDTIGAELQQRTSMGLQPGQRTVTPTQFSDVVLPAMLFPTGPMEPAEAAQRIHDNAQKYFEEKWIHQPLKSLNGVPPVDAVGHSSLRKKLLGVMQFLKDCAASGALHTIDFDRIKRQLGLTTGAPAATGEGAGGSRATLDIAALGAAELAGLKLDELSYEQLELAYRNAAKLSANELATNFARTLISRPPPAGHTDRFACYAFLAQQALTEGNKDDALNFVNQGEKDDGEHNQGQRQNDYELKRAQIHVKRAEASQAEEVFQRVIDRAPSEMKYRVYATEGMLSLRQGAAAVRFAEAGLAEARKKNDRDSEQHFQELLGAAKKQGG
jgi:tetratricopeptide (TPR) repeat protein